MVTRITPILVGTFELDGGAMFGVVPKSVWERVYPPEEGSNRCRWATRCLLVHTDDGRRIVVDTGLGDKDGERFQAHFRPRLHESLGWHLRAAALDPAEVTDVFLTHLHFDHVGGASYRDDAGDLKLVFPDARHWVCDRHWEWAQSPNAREAASFLETNLAPLRASGRLRFLPAERDDYEWLPGIRLRTLYGHTEAMQLLLFDRPDEPTIAYCADLLPSHAHLSLPWVMAYDLRPLDTLAEKERLLDEAVAGDWTLLFEHDARYAAARLERDARGRVVSRELLEKFTF